MKKISFILLSLVSLGGFAQQAKTVIKPHWQYSGILQGGIIGGSTELNYSVQTIQGVKKGPWLLGLGVGIDNYLVPGFPVVAHGAYHYGHRRSQPFVYAQAGPQIPWAKNEWDDKIGEANVYNLQTGWLAEGGLGYRFPLGKKLKFLTSLGYSIKQVKYDELQNTWWLFSSRWPTDVFTNPTYYHQKLTMNRLVLKIGVQF
jgi:hypothetical protein